MMIEDNIKLGDWDTRTIVFKFRHENVRITHYAKERSNAEFIKRLENLGDRLKGWTVIDGRRVILTSFPNAI